MNTEKQREKLIHAIIYFAKHTKYCHKLKIMKLLYYLDFWHFKETGRSVTGLQYKAWKKGPVPPKVYHDIEPKNNTKDFENAFFIENEEFENGIGHCLKIMPRKEFNPKIFSRREIQILEKVALIFNNAKAKDMSDSSHLRNSPWYKTRQEKGENEWIDYLLALDDEKNSIDGKDIKDREQIDDEFQQIIGEI
ncbi:MAG: Panacea domain-containing protein [candidate division KSB1 bacterium]|nr:Panacea domain-containing protein [candidate division KSB1 bacterium]